MKTSTLVRTAVAMIFVATLVWFFFLVFNVASQAVGGKRVKDFRSAVEVISKRCATRFPFRLTFITLNGGYVRLIGQHACNGVVRTEPGNMLMDPNPKRHVFRQSARRVRRLADHCKSLGARFFYVQLPKKLDLEQTMLPAGFTDAGYDNADQLLDNLREEGVEAVDWRAEFAAHPDDVSRNFYRTDHHWNNRASFRAAQMVVEALIARALPSKREKQRARELMADSAWTQEVVTNAFLGSLARRTGSLFAGVDDLLIRRPRFETQMRIEVPDKGIFAEGTFAETVMRSSSLVVSMSDGFRTDAYSLLYVGGLYPLVRHDNRIAPLNLKVVLIGDSFSRPVEGFLSTVVRRLIAVDLRRCSRRFSLKKLIDEERPDIVLEMLNPSGLGADTMVGKKTGRKIMFEYGF